MEGEANGEKGVEVLSSAGNGGRELTRHHTTEIRAVVCVRTRELQEISVRWGVLKREELAQRVLAFFFREKEFFSPALSHLARARHVAVGCRRRPPRRRCLLHAQLFERAEKFTGGSIIKRQRRSTNEK